MANVAGTAKALFQKKILGVPAPLVVGGAAVIAYLGYRYYKNRSANTSAQATPTGNLVTNPIPGGGSGGGTTGGGPDYSGQLATLATGLGTLQSNLAGLNSALAGLQGEQGSLQTEITTLGQHVNSQPAPIPQAANPVAIPVPLATYAPPVSVPQPVAASPMAQYSNLGSYVNPTPIPQVQQPFFYNNPVAYSGPTGYNGYNIPVYQPLPQYRGPQNPIVSQPYYSNSGLVASSTFGSGANAFQVGGHYVTYPNGQQIWVAG